MSKRLVKVDDEVHEWLAWASQKYGIKMKDVVGALVRIAQEYHVLEPDWIERIITDRLEEYRKKIEAQYEAKIEQRKMEWKLRFKHDLLMHYVKALDPEERKAFIENLLGNLDDPRFLEQLGEMELVTIDGKKRLCRIENGKPVIPNVDPERIVVCDAGYHIKGNFCECKRWRDCEIRVNEYAEYKAMQDMKRWKRL